MSDQDIMGLLGASDRPRTARIQRRFRDGREFVLDAPTTVPAIYGRGREVLWSQGEPLLVCGPQGVGKSTLVQQLMLHRIGVATDREFIGYPVERTERRVLYLAADRPRQIARSLRRMVTDADAQALADRLTVWEGPLPFSLVKEPERLVEWVAGAGAGDLYIDSLKDMLGSLSSDEVGGAYNRAIGAVIAAGIEVVGIHHQRKANSENRKPSKLEDVYGSVWITSGAGSVICLWGQPGDPIIELSHLKQPAEEVGPLDLLHDHNQGSITRRERPDAWTLLQAAIAGGISAQDAAAAIYGTCTKADVEKVRRRLEKFVADGKARRIDPGENFADVLYRPTPRTDTVTDRDEARDDASAPHAAVTPRHAAVTPRHAAEHVTSPLKEWGERDDEADQLAERTDGESNGHGELSEEAFAEAVRMAFPGSTVEGVA